MAIVTLAVYLRSEEKTSTSLVYTSFELKAVALSMKIQSLIPSLATERHVQSNKDTVACSSRIRGLIFLPHEINCLKNTECENK